MPKKPAVYEIKNDNQRRLTALGELLFGDFWINPMSRALAVDARQVMRWAKGEYEPPDEIVEQLGAMARKKAVRLMKVANRG